VEFPIIEDPQREIATAFGMLDPEEKDAAGMPMTCRAVFIIHNKALKLSLLYPATTGRNFDEIIRVIDSLQLTANHKASAPPAPSALCCGQSGLRAARQPLSRARISLRDAALACSDLLPLRACAGGHACQLDVGQQVHGHAGCV
jgi:hypothetical protein